LAIANKVNAEWMNLAKFAQEVADCAMQTVAMLSGQKNLFSRADILAAKRHIANEVDKEMDAPDPSKESLGPLLSHFDQMKKT
jgi:hypothetical protein